MSMIITTEERNKFNEFLLAHGMKRKQFCDAHNIPYAQFSNILGGYGTSQRIRKIILDAIEKGE